MKMSLRSLVVFLLLSGCSQETGKYVSTSEPILSQQYRQGSTTVIVSLSETNITSSGSIRFTVDVHAPANREVVFPEVGSAVEPFMISDGYTEPPQTLPNGKQRHRRVWILVPALPGETVFQPLNIQAGTGVIQTKPVVVFVTSLLPSGLTEFEIKDIAAPISLMPEQARQQRRWKIILVIAAGALLLFILLRHARKPRHIPTLPPHEIAFLALANLPDEPLEKIQALSEILVAYLGGRFELATAGKTIPEIIPLLPKERLLGRREKLEKYLVTGEQIRFSNRIPAGFSDDFEHYLHDFIQETAQEAACD